VVAKNEGLYLLTILMKNPNFLILDEPTNDLDILTLNVLEEYLLDFPGCLIIVTHDRYFMDKLVDHLFILEGNGVISDYNYTYSEYRELKKTEEREKQESKSSASGATQAEDLSKGKASFEQRKDFARLEKEIKKLEEKKAKLLPHLKMHRSVLKKSWSYPKNLIKSQINLPKRKKNGSNWQK
jgi:ATP-binding cassette subfamily F protein uup